jgi:hypothetical protein
MAQHDYIIANQSGAAFRADLNNGLAAIVSQNSGAAQPSTTYAYQWWSDTTTGLLKLRNAANNAWITVGTLADANLGLLSLAGGTLTGALLADDSGTAALPAIAFDGDPNTGIFSPGADQFGIATNGVERVEFGTSEVVFNDGGADVDFRIEGDTNANLFKIDAGLDEVQVANLNGGPIAGTRNRIINGDMRIDQRNASGGITPANFQYTVDRWRANLTQAGKFTTQQNSGSVTPPAGHINYLGVISTSAYSVVASDVFALNQAVEGLNVSDLGWGAAGAQSVTLSFWVRSSLTGTFGGAFQNSAQNRSYPFTYTVSAANTWEQKTITIAGDTSGTWLTTTDVGINLFFSLGAGTTFSGAAGSWSGSNFFSATGATSVVGTNGATFYITGVQLEPGTVATPFERRSFGAELALCQRYAYVNQQGDTGRAETTVKTDNSVKFPVTMRAAPSATVLGTLKYRDNSGTTTRTASSPSAPAVSPSTPDGAYYELTASSWSPSSFTIGNLTHICCDAGANGILFSSEL